MPIGSLIGAGASLLGGLFNRDSTAAANAANIQHQREFAQKGIRWKVEDAKAAGIHPLAALGAQTTAFSPAVVGDTLGSSIASAGQDVSRAINATRDPSERLGAVGKTMQDLALQRAGLENQLLAAQIRKVNQAGMPPALPGPSTRYLMDGQGNSTPLVKDEALERVTAAPEAPYAEPGAITDVGYARTTTGHAPVPSKDVKERIEDNLVQELMWAIRNNLLPSVGVNQAPPPTSPGRGNAWVFLPWRQEYQALPRNSWVARLLGTRSQLERTD